MLKTKSKPEDLLPLTPAVFQILMALTEGEMHGYGIMQEIVMDTNGKTQMGPGTLYGTIKRLLEAGLIEESDNKPDTALSHERRRYYRLTGLGQRVVEAEARRYHDMVKLARRKRLLVRGIEAAFAGGH